MTARRALARLAALVRKRDLEQDLEFDIAAHLELAERDALARGVSPEEARQSARKMFGGVEQMKEAHREHRGIAWMDTLIRDVRYGVASLVRSPGFTAAVISVLALGIGANVAMFSLVDAVLLKPLPFPEPDRIVRVWEAPRPGITNATSTLDFLDWARLATKFEAIAAEIPVSAALTADGEAVRLSGKAVTSEYFHVFGVGTQTGRTFTSEEGKAGAPRVVVISNAVWKTRFNSDPGILSRVMVLDGEPHQVIGVLPPGAFDRDQARFWKNLVFTPDQYLRDSHWLLVHARLRAGVTLAQARGQMRAIHSELDSVTPQFKRNWKIEVESLTRLLAGDNLRRSISILFGAVVLVLLIACANVVNLLLAKGAARRKEIGIRAALGASRGRLAAQLLTEGLVLCLLGGAAGLAVAIVLIRAAAPYLVDSIPYTANLMVDYRVFGFGAAAALGVGLLVGALPALQISAGNPGLVLGNAPRGSSGSHQRMRRFVVVAEVALSLVLICGAFLLFRSLANLQQIETGVRIENVITMAVDLPVQRYPTVETAAAFYEAVASRIRNIPGVRETGVSTHLPLQWIANGEAVQAPGVKELINIRFKRVDAGYFQTMGIPLIAGRGIDQRDRLGARRVVVINEALAKRLADIAAMSNPVGRTVTLYCPRYVERGAREEQTDIVGVIRSERVANPGMPDPPVAYVPLAQVPATGIKILVRTQAAPSSVVSGVRQVLRQIDANVPIGEIATMEEIREKTLTGVSRPAWLIGAFAVVSAALAAIGLFGVLSQAVTQRRREIGIRMALGARSHEVISYVVRNAISVISIGLVLGMAGTFALTRVLNSLLYKVSPLDPMALAEACAAMLVIGLAAAFIPASRAARVDPASTLREEG